MVTSLTTTSTACFPLASVPDAMTATQLGVEARSTQSNRQSRRGTIRVTHIPKSGRNTECTVCFVSELFHSEHSGKMKQRKNLHIRYMCELVDCSVCTVPPSPSSVNLLTELPRRTRAAAASLTRRAPLGRARPRSHIHGVTEEEFSSHENCSWRRCPCSTTLEESGVLSPLNHSICVLLHHRGQQLVQHCLVPH